LLARKVNVCIVTEEDCDYRQTKLGFRFNSHHSRNSIHLILDGKGDELFDFLWCEALRFGVDLDLHRRHVRKGVDVQAIERQDAARHDQHRHDGHQQSLAIKEGNKIVGHGLLLRLTLLQ
jgi:hypothetical protein